MVLFLHEQKYGCLHTGAGKKIAFTDKDYFEQVKKGV